MLMMTALNIAAYGGPFVMAFLGFVVTGSQPKTRRARYVWYAAFLVTAAVSVLAAITESGLREKKVQEAHTGGDHYAYLWAEVDSAKDTAGPVPIWLQASGLMYAVHYWIAPGDVSDPNDARYWSIWGGSISETTGGFRVGRTLPLGKYRVEFSARNGFTVQTLEIKESRGKLVQLIDVFRPGEGKIFSNH